MIVKSTIINVYSTGHRLCHYLLTTLEGIIYDRNIFIIQATDPNLLLDGLEIMEPREKVIRPPF